MYTTSPVSYTHLYLYICGVTDDVTTLLPVHITKGRMPENDSELLLPEHLAYDGGIAYNLNDEITLDVGERVDEDGFVLDNNTSLLGNCLLYTSRCC